MRDKILLVAQNDQLRQTLTSQLARWGYAPLYASRMAEAVQAAQRDLPPLALIDNALQGVDALALLRKLRSLHPWSEVILLVSLENIERGAQGLELGASDFLVKPVSAARLGIALKRAQERLAMRRKLSALAGPFPAGGTRLLAQTHNGGVCATRLYDSQQQYQQLFDEVPCYISVLDRDFRFTAANRRYKEEFGYDEGVHCYQACKQLSERCQECPVAETFRDGQSHSYEQVLTSVRGEQYNVLTFTAPIRDASGEITQVMAMSTNITEIRSLQDHLASLGMLIGSISHGVKGLITALDGGMYNLRSGFLRQDPERLQKGWEVVELMVGRIRRTVLDILYYAKERALDLEEVDVAEFARQVAFTGEYAAKKHDLGFLSRVAPDLGSFEVDPNALNPALINLLENAVDACLSDRSKTGHQIIFSAHREGDVIVFDVEDNGMGMDEATVENMFTLFFTSKGSAGTGLGLFIANDTVQQHGGEIAVDSELDQGTHIHVRIPVRPRRAHPPRED